MPRRKRSKAPSASAAKKAVALEGAPHKALESRPRLYFDPLRVLPLAGRLLSEIRRLDQAKTPSPRVVENRFRPNFIRTRERAVRSERLPPRRKQPLHAMVIPSVDDRKHRICPKRQARRQVLFSKLIAGHAGRSPGKNHTYRRNVTSQYSCKRR